MRTGAFTVRHGEIEHKVTLSPAGEAHVDDEAPVTVAADGQGVLRVRDGERWRRVVVHAAGDARQVFVDGEVYELTVGDGSGRRARGGRSAADAIVAPMPAKVTAVMVEPGSQVAKGDILLKLEAMKMELPVRAPRDGVVGSVSCKVGDLVQPGVPLVELE